MVKGLAYSKQGRFIEPRSFNLEFEFEFAFGHILIGQLGIG